MSIIAHSIGRRYPVSLSKPPTTHMTVNHSMTTVDVLFSVILVGH